MLLTRFGEAIPKTFKGVRHARSPNHCPQSPKIGGCDISNHNLATAQTSNDNVLAAPLASLLQFYALYSDPNPKKKVRNQIKAMSERLRWIST